MRTKTRNPLVGVILILVVIALLWAFGLLSGPVVVS
jgi:cellobiose-specific phosphotransferase system component IIC